MRVVGGSWKGHPLEGPRGRAVTRPTTDRVREAMASMVASACGLDLSDVRVLDAFAGSGAMGIELLSRGAAHATFVDQDRPAAARVRRNLRSVGADPASWDVVCAPAEAAVARGRIPGGPFGVVFLDPPYRMPAPQVSRLVLDAVAHGILVSGALVLYERASEGSTLELPATTLKSKRYGTTCVDLLRLGADTHEPESR